VFSYIDLVRVEIALEAEEQFGITILDEETEGWRTLGDVARSVAGRAGGRVTEAEIFDWLRTLIAEGYGISAQLTPEEGVFSDYDRMTAWFLSPPYPYELGDRWFARNTGGQSGGGPAEHNR
jgi:hypothetical protein